MHPVYPLPGQIGKCGAVLIGGRNRRLEAPHLAARGRLFGDGIAANDPPHDRIEAQPIRIVHVVLAAKATKH